MTMMECPEPAQERTFRDSLHQRARHLGYVAAWMAVDALVITAAYLAALVGRLLVTPSGIIQLPDIARYTAFIAPVLVTTLIVLYLFGVYRHIWSCASGQQVLVLVHAMIFATGLISAANLLLALPQRPLPLSAVLFANVLALGGLVLVRYRERALAGVKWRWRAIWHREFPQNQKRVLVVGAGESGQATVRRFHQRTVNRDSYKIVGFVDDDPAKRGMIVEGVRVLGTRADIPRLAAEHRADLIVIAVHNISGADFRDILNHCQRTEARIRVAPDLFAMLDTAKATPPLRELQPEDLLGRKPIGRYAGIDLGPVTGKAILVTGAAGSIGAELCRQLLAYEPTALIMLDNNESGLHDIFTELSARHPTAPLVPILADITDAALITEVFRERCPQVVFHAAAYKHVPMLQHFPDQAVRVNIAGTWNIASMAKGCNTERFVLISTDKAVNPSSVMGASKRVCELMMAALAQQTGHRTMFTAVRFGNVLGSRGSVVPTFNRQIDSGGPVTITDARMRRYFMSITEAVNLVIHAACLTRGGDLFMLKMGEEVPIIEIAERMIRMRGLRPHEDIAIKEVGMRPGEKLHEELHCASEHPLPTVHPGIVQLVDQDNHFFPETFMATLEQMCTRQPGEDVDMVRQMFMLAGRRVEA